MRQISLVGAVDEEVGDFFPEFLDMLEESPFLRVSNGGGGGAAERTEGAEPQSVCQSGSLCWESNWSLIVPRPKFGLTDIYCFDKA